MSNTLEPNKKLPDEYKAMSIEDLEELSIQISNDIKSYLDEIKRS
jgi:hypothetical protein